MLYKFWSTSSGPGCTLHDIWSTSPNFRYSSLCNFSRSLSESVRPLWLSESGATLLQCITERDTPCIILLRDIVRTLCMCIWSTKWPAMDTGCSTGNMQPTSYHRVVGIDAINAFIRPCRVPEWAGGSFSLDGHEERCIFRSRPSRRNPINQHVAEGPGVLLASF